MAKLEDEVLTTAAKRTATANRSPNYPQMSIEQAIIRVKKVYAIEHTHSVPEMSVAVDLGYSTLNGSSKSVISALKKYGLLAVSGGELRVSEDAIAISELPAGNYERSEAVRRCALRPIIFRELHERYGDSKLPSDASIRHFLIGRGFESDGANQVIRFFKETLEYLSKEAPELTIDSAEDEDVIAELPIDHQAQRPAGYPNANLKPLISDSGRTVPNNNQSLCQLRFQISPVCMADITFTSDVTQEAISKLIALLELSKDVYPSQNTRGLENRTTRQFKAPFLDNDESQANNKEFEDFEELDLEE
jgi:hypothetical protein